MRPFWKGCDTLWRIFTRLPILLARDARVRGCLQFGLKGQHSAGVPRTTILAENSASCETFASEDQFQSKLDFAGGGARSTDAARRWANLAGGKDGHVRDTEVCRVGNVEAFSTELQGLGFLDGDGLKQREIKFRQARTVQDASPHIAPGPHRRLGCTTVRQDRTAEFLGSLD